MTDASPFPPHSMHAALADTRAALDNPTVDQNYSWLNHASDAEIDARFAALQRNV